MKSLAQNWLGLTAKSLGILSRAYPLEKLEYNFLYYKVLYQMNKIIVYAFLIIYIYKQTIYLIIFRFLFSTLNISSVHKTKLSYMNLIINRP